MSRDDSDSGLDDRTLRALQAGDDLVPTHEAEVERAETAMSSELELPEGLQQYRPRAAQATRAAPSREVRSLPQRRSQFLGYAVTMAFGALAAGATLSWLSPAPSVPVTSAGGELMPSSASAHAPLVPLVLHSRCERDCCAGSACQRATEGLASCPSGIRCAACAADNVTGGPYRLRLGSMIVSDAGQKLLPLDAPLELCVVAATDTVCLPAMAEAGGDSWRLLKVVTPLQDLLTGLAIELRKRGDNAALASWKHAVSPTPDILCKGLAIQLNDGTETVGRLSAFVEPTHFVELSRAAAVPDLLKTLRRFDVSGLVPHVYESSRPGAARFALVLGPLDKADADALRWQVLDHGLEANVSHGLDFVGNPRPAE